MAWQWDHPAGVYKDHALSSRIRAEAARRSLFARWARPESGFGKHRGQSLTVTRIRQLPSAADPVGELDRLPEGRPGIEVVQVTTKERGFKIPTTQFESDLTHFDMNNQFQRMLRDQMRLSMDIILSTAVKKTPYKYIPLAAGGVFDTDGTPSSTADANLKVADLRKIHDEMSGILNIPTFANGKYVGILTTKAARGIKSDSEYKDWLSPTGRGEFLSGMLPVPGIEGFDLFETNHYSALANAVGSGGVLGEAVFFGDDAYGLATVMDPELRAGIPSPEDLGRHRYVGWVANLEAFLIWEQAATARTIHVTSA